MLRRKILSCVGKQYSGRAGAVEPMYLEFTDPIRDLGYEVHHFDQAEVRAKRGFDACGSDFIAEVSTGGYEAVLYQTAGQDWMPRAALAEAGRFAPIVAWNSDDDWQWEPYTMRLAPYFTFMVTTYPHIFDQYKSNHSNLRLSQWGCYDRFADLGRRKDLDFTFAGAVYGHRNNEARCLRRRAGLKAFGLGAGLVNLGLPYFRGAWRLPMVFGRAMDFRQINDIWNRSRISFTPMGASADRNLWQIKSRAFEMGLSGTLMLCQPSPNLERYYVPEREFVGFRTIEECAEKALYYLKNETARAKIARAYYERTKAEHLWQHRFRELFQEIGIPPA